MDYINLNLYNDKVSNKCIFAVVLLIALCFSGLGYNLMNHPLSFGQTTDSDGKKHQVAFSKGPNRQFLFESFNVCIVLYLFVLGVVLHDWISTENSQKGKRTFYSFVSMFLLFVGVAFIYLFYKLK